MLRNGLLSFPRNVAWTYPLRWRDRTTGASYNWTGSTFRLEFRLGEDPSIYPLILALNSPTGILLTDLANSTITINYTAFDYPVVTDANKAPVWQLIRVAGGTREHLLGGRAAITNGVVGA